MYNKRVWLIVGYTLFYIKDMFLLNTNFSEQGFKHFLTLTREEQKAWLRKRNPLYTIQEIEKALKGIKHGKRKRTKKAVKKSNSK